MFTPDTLSCDVPIIRFLLLGERMEFGFLLGRATVFMSLVQTLIPAIGQTKRGRWQNRTAGFEESKICCFAFTKGGSQDHARLFVGDYLCFLGMTLLLAGVVASLFFFGR